MVLIHRSAILCCGFLLLLPLGTVAEQPEAVPAECVTANEDLAAFGKAVVDTVDYKDNVFVYEQLEQDLQQTARTFEGTTLEFVATVMRVTKTEVRVDVEHAGKTRLLLKHDEAPPFGNLHTVYYPGTLSTERFNPYALPVGLRIEAEIALDVASQLRKGDLLRMRGRIDSMQVVIRSVFNPLSVATLTDWQVIEVVPGPDLPGRGY